MKFSVLQDSLKKSLDIIKDFVPSKPNLSVLENILISTDGQRIRLSSTTLSIGVNVWCGGKIDEDGAICVNFKDFYDYVRLASPERMDFELNGEKLNARSGGGKRTFKTVASTEYPLVPQGDNSKGVVVEGLKFKNQVKQAYISAAKEDNRPILNAINCQFNADNYVLATADGYRLDIHNGDLLQTNTEPFIMNAPAKELVTVVDNLDTKTTRNNGGYDWEIKIQREDSLIFIHAYHATYVMSHVEGTFPDYMAIVPKTLNFTASMYTEELKLAAKRLQPIAKKVANAVGMYYQSFEHGIGSLTVHAKHGTEASGEEIVDCSFTGQRDSFENSINVDYIIDYTSAIKDDKVVIEMSSDSAPIVIYPMNRRDENIHVIMPMSVGNWDRSKLETGLVQAIGNRLGQELEITEEAGYSKTIRFVYNDTDFRFNFKVPYTKKESITGSIQWEDRAEDITISLEHLTYGLGFNRYMELQVTDFFETIDSYLAVARHAEE